MSGKDDPITAAAPLRIPWVPSKEATKEARAYIRAGGRLVEFELGDEMVPGVRLDYTFRKGYRYVVEVRGSALLGVRAKKHGSSIFGNDTIEPLTISGEMVWDEGVARVNLDMHVNLSKIRWAVIAQADLWQFAYLIRRGSGAAGAQIGRVGDA